MMALSLYFIIRKLFSSDIDHWLFHDGTGFYMITASVMKELNITISHEKNLVHIVKLYSHDKD